MGYPTDFWQRASRGYGCGLELAKVVRYSVKRDETHSVVMDGEGPATYSLRSVSLKLQADGYMTKGGKKYEPQQVKDKLLTGLAWSGLWVCNLPRTQKNFQRMRDLMERALSRKTCFSKKTPDDPYLYGRLEWWKYRKVGRKPSSQQYEKRKAR